MHPEKTTMQEVFTKFGLDANTGDFIGHALALQPDEKLGKYSRAILIDGFEKRRL